MSNDFAILTANRKRTNAVYGIFRITKSGQLSKTPSATEPTEEYAERTRARIAELNPNSTFVVKAL